MTTDRAALCARNNALWCDAVCRAHGVPGEFVGGLWLNRQPVPRFYSNVVTLSPKDPAGQRAWVEHLMTRRASFSVKDSFVALDLSRLGFDVLFEATWLWREPTVVHPTFGSGLHLLDDDADQVRRTQESASHQAGLHLLDGDADQVRPTQESASHQELAWSVVTDDAGLALWEAAWAGLHAGQVVPGSERIFRRGLLREPGVALLAGARDGQLVAVAAANQTGEVVGLSNVFAPAAEAAACWAGAVAFAAALFPGRPLVGYERGDDLARAQAVGFVPVGPLQVWAR